MRIKGCMLLLGMALGLAAPRLAGAIGHYVPGLPNARDLFVPPPGLYLVNYTYWYHADTFKDRNGATVDSFTVNIPGQGPRRFSLDTDVDQLAIVPTLVWAPDWDFHGVRWAAYAAQGFANISLNAAVEAVDVDRTIATEWGAADVFVQPIWLQWSPLTRLDAMFGYGFYAPTGRYDVGADTNTGLGYWTQQLQAGAAIHADEAKTLSLLMVSTWELNSAVQDQDIDPGNRFTLNWTISKIWLDGFLETAILGYDQWQMGANTGRDVLPIRQGALDAIHAAGLQLGVPKLGLSLKYLHEFAAKARFQGSVLTFTFTVPIDMLIEAAGSL
jgi:hypothetical protein